MFNFYKREKNKKTSLSKFIKKQRAKNDNLKPKLVIFSGAGISAESGIQTFRDSNGLWENHSVQDVASPDGFKTNPNLVIDFYNERRKQIFEAKPNEAHLIIAELEEFYDVTVITQNIDNFHERAGSTCVYHLHGKIDELRSNATNKHIYKIENAVQEYDERCPKTNGRLRPNVVWFGEQPYYIVESRKAIAQADVVIVCGTSLSVQPAASLLDYVSDDTKCFIFDLKTPIINSKIPKQIKFKQGKASELFKETKESLIKYAKKYVD